MTFFICAKNFTPDTIVVIPHFAFDYPWAEGADGDIPRCRLMRQALRNTNYAHLVGDVVRGIDETLTSLTGRGTNQIALVLLNHIFCCFPMIGLCASGTYGEDFFGIGFRHAVEVVDGSNTRVLNRGINGAEARCGLLVQRLHLHPIGDVHLQR